MNRHMADIIQQQDPVRMAPGATVQEACRTMHQAHVGAVLITEEDGHLLGIFTRRDVIRLTATGVQPEVTPLKTAMTSAPDCLQPRCTAIEALRLMHDGGFHHIPVTDDTGRVIGIVSDDDFCSEEQDRLDEEVSLWERIR